MTKKIKLLHIITKLELGGAQRNTLYTVKKLSAKDEFDVLLVSGSGGILDEEAKNIRDIKFISSPRLVREINPIKDFLALVWLLGIFLREKPDIIHTHSSKAGILGRFAGALYNFSCAFMTGRRKIKIVHTYHGFGFTPEQPAMMRRILILIEKIASHFSDILIFVSEANRRVASLYGFADDSRRIIIRSGVDVSFFKNFTLSDEEREMTRKKFGISPDEKMVLTIGPFKKQKNLGDFIRIAAEIKKRGIKSRFILVGDGHLKQELAELAGRLGVAEDVIFAGWLTSKTDIAQLLKTADVFLMTSLWEGLPRSIVEAVSAGCPVCANAVDGVTDIISDGETGLLAEPFDIAKAADNVEKILSDPSFARRLALAASQKIDEEFDIEKMVTHQEELYKSLLMKSP